MIILSGGIKGGCGKSTIAVNFAVMRSKEGREVLLIDADAQQSSTDFTAMRNDSLDGKAGYQCIALTGKAVLRDGRKLAEKYDDVIIDAGGRDTASQRAALAFADAYLVPFLPSGADVWTLEQVETLVEEMAPANPDLNAFCFLNRADHQGQNNSEAAEILRESETLTFIEAAVGDRKVFRNAFSEGLAITEYKPRDNKARAEINALYTHIFNI